MDHDWSCLFQFRLVGNGEFVTPLCTAASQYFTTVGGLHPLAEAVNRLAATSVWLKCTLHLITILTILISFLDRGHHPAAGERDGKGIKKSGKNPNY